MPVRHCYTYRFEGVLLGALGVRAVWTQTVLATTQEEARLKLYETHEHISGCILLSTTEAPQ